MKAKLRVLIISQHFWPEEFRVNDLALELRGRGHEVTVLTGVPNYPRGAVFPDFQHDPQAFSTYEDIPIVRVPLVPRGGASGGRLVLNYLSFAVAASTVGLYKLRGRRFDATVVFMSSPAFQALPATILRILIGTPALLWVQDLWPQTLSAVGAVRSRAVLRMVGAFVSGVYRAAWGILIQSEQFREDVQRRAGNRAHVLYLPNWADPHVARGLSGVPVAPELAPVEGCFNLLFAGNLGEAQDLPTVIEAAHRCRDLAHLRWLLVGEGRARAAAEALVSKLDLRDRVVFLGRQPSARMPEFFAGADALLVSLRADPVFAMTIPSKVQTYLAAARPIIGMLDGEGARVINESGGGFVAPAGDAAGLSEAVRRLVAMPDQARRVMAERGRAYAGEQFDKDLLVDRLVGWMEAASGRNPRGL